MEMHMDNEHFADMHSTASFEHVERKDSRQPKRQQEL